MKVTVNIDNLKDDVTDQLLNVAGVLLSHTKTKKWYHKYSIWCDYNMNYHKLNNWCDELELFLEKLNRTEDYLIELDDYEYGLIYDKVSIIGD